MGELRRITEHYRLDKLVASSDSGSVFRATALATGAHVAVKLIGDIDERSTAQRDGFLKAAIELRSLRHPGVPQTLDFGFTTGGSAFLVTEYVNGASLGLLVGAEPKQVVGIALHLVAALEALGAQGIPYHNLRLDNVLVVPGGDEDGIKLLGLCSALSLFGPSDESPSPVLPPDAPGGSAGRPGDVAALDLRRFATLVCQLLGVSPDAPDAGIAPAKLELPASATSLPRPEALRSWLASCLQPAPEAHLLTWVAARGALQWSLGVGSAREEACDAEAGRQTIQAASGSRLENTLMILPVPPTEGEAALPARGVGGGERLEKTVQIRPEALVPEGTEAAGPALLAGQLAPAGGTAGAFEKTVQLRALPGDHTLAHPASRREAGEPPAPGDRPLSPETLPSFWPPEPAQPSGETRAPVALGLVESGPREPTDPPDSTDPPDPTDSTGALQPAYLLQPDLPAVPAAEPAPLPVRPHRLRVVPREGLEAETAAGAPEIPAPDPPRTVHAAASGTGAAATSPRQPPSTPPADLRGPRVRGGGWRPAAIVAGALLVLAGGGALIMLWPRQPRRTPISTPVALSASRLQPPAAAPGASHSPAGSSAPTTLPSPPGPALAPGIALAEAALAGGDLAAARQALAEISPELVASLQLAERERYEAAAAAVELASREQVARELSAGFDSGNLARLNSALAISRGLHAPPSQLRQGLDRARRAVAAAARLARAERGHNQAEVLVAASDLQRELPTASQAGAAREQAAAALEGQVQAALDAGQGERAVAALEDIRRSWPDRSGLNESFARVTAQRQADSRLESALAAAARAEQAGLPLQGLEALAGARPNGRFADRFRAQRERLEDLLARLDSSPPKVALAEAFKSEYEKGAVSVPLRITDDFQVKTVECWARAQGGTYAPVPVRHGTGPDYLVEIPESLHQNKMIEFYVIASDPSGHQGLLGSRSEPVRIKRKGWLSRIFGAKPTEQR